MALPVHKLRGGAGDPSHAFRVAQNRRALKPPIPNALLASPATLQGADHCLQELLDSQREFRTNARRGKSPHARP